MLLQTFCYWNKQQPADSNLILFHLTHKRTKGQSSYFCDCFLIWKWIFQHHDRGLTKFRAGSEQPLVGVVISNSSYPTAKSNNPACHAFGEYLMQAREFLNNRLKYCWPEVIFCICQPNDLKREIKKKTGEPSRGATQRPQRPPLGSPLHFSNAKNMKTMQKLKIWKVFFFGVPKPSPVVYLHM